LLRANAEGAPHIIGADFPSSGADFVTALAMELGFPFFAIKKEKLRHAYQPHAMKALGFLCGCPSWL
jgi:hypothetical protein